MRELSITTTETTTADNLLAALASGEAVLHTERSNGTFRRVHFLTEGTEARETAEWVKAMREGDEEGGRAPRTMASIAAELISSIPSVRRLLNDLALTHEFEEMEREELEELLHGGQEAEDTMVVQEGEAEELEDAN